MRALFAVARVEQPSVIFIDEIDSLLTGRSSDEQESTRRIKTEFLVQWDGVGSNKADGLLVIGATNRPQELDEAARRRLAKRLYIPLPEAASRQQLIANKLAHNPNTLTDQDVEVVVGKTDGFSGSDLGLLCTDAAMGPMREKQKTRSFEQMATLKAEEMRPIELKDFEAALFQVRASVAQADLASLVEWNTTFGSSVAGS